METIINMWFSQRLGMDPFYFLNCFFVYSFLGWIFECIVISYQEKSVVNRGFIRGPFCTIYGVGALGAYYIFRPIAHNAMLLFLCGAVLATTFEFLVAKLMMRIFGEFWWDYNNKPFNYKGVVCLESTICWGVMSMLLFILFQPMVQTIVNTYYYRHGKAIAVLLVIIYMLDFTTSFHRAYRERRTRDSDEQKFEYLN